MKLQNTIAASIMLTLISMLSTPGFAYELPPFDEKILRANPGNRGSQLRDLIQRYEFSQVGNGYISASRYNAESYWFSNIYPVDSMNAAASAVWLMAHQLDENSQDPRAVQLNNVAVYFMDQLDYGAAIRALNAALTIAPNYAIAKGNLKLAAFRKTEESKNLEAVQNIQKSSPDTSKQNEVDYSDYMSSLQRTIRRSWEPPALDNPKIVQVLFSVDRAGKVLNLKIRRSSGDAATDQSALNAVQSSSPFGPLPAGAPKTVDVQFTFDQKSTPLRVLPSRDLQRLAKSFNAKSKSGSGSSYGREQSIIYRNIVLRNYQKLIDDMIWIKWSALKAKDPVLFQSKRKELTVLFSISKNGGISKVKVYSSSGNARLDDAACSSISSLTSFPPPPPEGPVPLNVEYHFGSKADTSSLPSASINIRVEEIGKQAVAIPNSSKHKKSADGKTDEFAPSDLLIPVDVQYTFNAPD